MTLIEELRAREIDDKESPVGDLLRKIQTLPPSREVSIAQTLIDGAMLAKAASRAIGIAEVANRAHTDLMLAKLWVHAAPAYVKPKEGG